MSNQFNFEPSPNTKILLSTSVGDIELELWGKECPIAVRNFIQLCMESYYDGNIFHRVVPNFIVQTGDPTGTGFGGESIYGKDFEIEVHPRLRFNRRGLIGMANTGKNDNNSQFFITLGNALELQGKHTCFGRIVGDTIFNVLKISECETDKDDRPLLPPKILNTKILLNPFDDIIPRISEKELELQAKPLTDYNNNEVKPKKKGKKDKNLLSFQDDEDGALNISSSSKSKKFKMKSSFDTDNNNVLSKDQPIIKTVLDLDIEPNIKAEKSEKLSTKKEIKANEEDEEKSTIKPTPSALDKKEETKLKIKQLEEELKNGTNNKESNSSAKNTQKKSFLELQREKYSKTAIIGKRKINENDTLNKLFSFQSKLTSTKVAKVTTVTTVSQESSPLNEEECRLHSVPNCQSCNREINSNQEESIDDSWMAHKLKFEKDRLGKDLSQRKDKLDDYTVIDPRAQKKH